MVAGLAASNPITWNGKVGWARLGTVCRRVYSLRGMTTNA